MMNHNESGVSPSDQLNPVSLPMINCIGAGSLGAKAGGLQQIVTRVLPRFNHDAFPGVTVEVPQMTVISTDCFMAFMDLNRLWEFDTEDLSDSAIAKVFLRSELPTHLRDELRAVITRITTPLAVRSSSFLEGEGDQSPTGINFTKMIPNNQSSVGTRLRRLTDAVKLVWASTFFRDSISTRRAAGQDADAERTAIIIQEVVGSHHGDRFYPTLSGIARSYNHYPSPGMRSEEGVITLVHGLGKSLIEGEASWTYSPVRPLAPPPFANTRDVMRFTQVSSWAINTAGSQAPSPIRDTECLVRMGLRKAESDGTLKYLASTYDAASDRIQSGLSSTGPRILNFAPLLGSTTLQFKEVIAELLRIARDELKTEVELEFAVDLEPDTGSPMRFGLLQMRPLHSAGEHFPVVCDEARPDAIVVGSDASLGNGCRTDLSDIIYLRPENFAPSRTRTIAAELEAINRGLIDHGRHAILIGFGRWGSSDERAGVPVRWAQISSTRAIVEAAHPKISADLSLGTTFFHRLLNFKVMYLSVGKESPSRINWQWLDEQPAVWESHDVRHIRLEEPLEVRVDGTTGCGIVRKISSS